MFVPNSYCISPFFLLFIYAFIYLFIYLPFYMSFANIPPLE